MSDGSSGQVMEAHAAMRRRKGQQCLRGSSDADEYIAANGDGYTDADPIGDVDTHVDEDTTIHRRVLRRVHDECPADSNVRSAYRPRASTRSVDHGARSFVGEPAVKERVPITYRLGRRVRRSGASSSG